MSRSCIKKLLVETVEDVFTDILFLDSDSPYYIIKNDLKLLKEKALEKIPKQGRTEANEAQSWH